GRRPAGRARAPVAARRGADAFHGGQVPARFLLHDTGIAKARRGHPRLSAAPDRRVRLLAPTRGAQMKVSIDYAVCNSCGLCREVCPESAIRPKMLEPRHLYEVMPEKCTGCGESLEYCPAPGALVQYE